MSKKRWVLSLLGATALAIALAGSLLTAGGHRTAQAGVLAQETPTPVPASQAKAWLGVAIAQLNQQLAERLGLSQQEGVVVVRVLAYSPAAQAGLLAKDIISAIDGAQVTTVREVQDRIKEKNAGDTVTVSILRGSATQNVNVTLGTRPEPQPKPHFPLGLGFLPGLSELEGIAPRELFDHVLGFDLRITDKEGQPLTLRVVPGTTISVSDTSLTIDPNGPETTATYSVTTDTVVAVPGRQLSALQPGDKVMVVTVDDLDVARAVMAARGLRGRGFGLGAHWGMPFGMGERSFQGPPQPGPSQQQGRSLPPQRLNREGTGRVAPGILRIRPDNPEKGVRESGPRARLSALFSPS